VSLCALCEHKTRGAGTCAAYPNGIPAGFLNGSEAHLTTTGDDNGITFTPDPRQYIIMEEALELAGPDAYKKFLRELYGPLPGTPE
jgi:hypothetical protein